LSADEPLAQQAQAYLLSCSEDSAVIPGLRTKQQLNSNNSTATTQQQQLNSNIAAAGKRLHQENIRNIEAFWNTITHHGQALLPW
jgi:aryl-alcohol dehydrogenase-like predicted oxidoreductase